MTIFENKELWSEYSDDTPARDRKPLPVAEAASRPDAWRYRTQDRRWLMLALSLGVAGSLHAVALLAFNHKKAAVKATAVEDTTVELIVMPDLSKLEEPELAEVSDPVDNTPIDGSFVPMQADLPSAVILDSSFVQQIDFNSLQPRTDLSQAKVVSIPTQIRRGGVGTGGLKDVFNIAQLDRAPEAVFQPAPIFPPSLKKEVQTARVDVEFIVTGRGEVVEVRVVSSTHPGFEAAAVAGVSRWQFRAGMKSGRKVNTRMMVPLMFKVVE